MYANFTRSRASVQRLAQSVTARQAALVAGANGTSAALRLAVVLLLAGMMSEAEYGYLGIFIALLDTASIVCESGLHPALVRFFSGKSGGRAALVRRALLIKLGLVALCVGGALLGYGIFLARLDIPGDYAWMYPAAVGAGILLSFHMFGMAMLQALQRFGLYATLSVSINAVRLVVLGALIALGTPSFELLAGLFFATPAVGALLGLLLVSAAWKRPASVDSEPGPGLRGLFAFMAPLAIVQWLVIAVERGDIWLLQALTAPEETASLVLAKQAALIFPIMAQALFTVLLPKVAAIEDRDALRAYRRRVIRLAPVFAALGVVAMFAAPPVLQWLLGGRYAAAMPVLMVLYFAYGFSLIQNPLSLVFYALDRVHHITLMHALQVPLFFGSCIVLIPNFGAMGAAVSYLVIRLFAVLYMLVFTARALRDSPPNAEFNQP